METSKKTQIGCGLEAKFGPNYVQCCEKSKETGNIRFFHILLGDYLLKQEAVVVKPPECKFMAIMAMPNFQDVMAKFLPDLGQKWQKN